jgi:16S rRNA A1518/A1519 N6-dimethyltransferase RsmA/KsgA/DIM1 with predicted DNA glycosylase/AP lyase activity
MARNLTNSNKYKIEDIKKALEELGIAEQARGQEVEIDKWKELYKLLTPANNVNGEIEK